MYVLLILVYQFKSDNQGRVSHEEHEVFQGPLYDICFPKETKRYMLVWSKIFNRPGEAGAVLHTPP